jgi:hypothetical protein
MDMTDLKGWMVFWGSLALVALFVMSTGCASLKKDTTGLEETEPEVTRQVEEPEPLYYDFEDVLVPIELKVDKKKSFVYHPLVSQPVSLLCRDGRRSIPLSDFLKTTWQRITGV